VAQREVIQFNCDNCNTPGEPENIAGHPRRITLPKGWVVLGKETNYGPAADLQLCADCMQAVTFALQEVRLLKD